MKLKTEHSVTRPFGRDDTDLETGSLLLLFDRSRIGRFTHH